MPFNDNQLAFLDSLSGRPAEALPEQPSAARDYRRQDGLRDIVTMSPEERAESERIEAGAGAKEELQRELARTRDPKARAVLLAEAGRRGVAVDGAVPAGEAVSESSVPVVRALQVGGLRPRVVAPVRPAAGDAYAAYADQARERAVAGGEDLLAASVEAERQAQRKAALDKGPTLGDYAKAAGASMVSGFGDMMQGIVGEPLAFLANTWSGREDYVGFNPLKPAAEAIRGSMSEAGQAARQDQPKGDLFDPASWTMPERASSLLMLGAEGFGSLIPSMLPAIGLAGRVQKAGQALQAAEKAGNAAKIAAATQELQAAQRLSMLASGATAGGMTAGAAAGDVRETVAKQVGAMSHDELLGVPLYAKAFAATGDAGAARQAVVNGAAQYAGVLSGLAGAAGGATTSKLIDDILVKQGMAKVLGKVSGNAAVRGGVAATGGAAAEGLQEVSEQVGQNVGENLALGKPVGDDAGRDTFGAFVGGALVGGPVGGAGGALSEAPSAPAVKPKANSPLSNAAAAGNPATAQAFAQAKAEEDKAAFPDGELNAMRDKVGAWLDDRGNIAMLRQRDPAMVGEAFHVWNNVINNPEVALRTRISALEQAVGLIDGLPNFTLVDEPGLAAGEPPAAGDDSALAGGPLVPAGSGGSGAVGSVDPAAGSIPGEATRIAGELPVPAAQLPYRNDGNSEELPPDGFVAPSIVAPIAAELPSDAAPAGADAPLQAARDLQHKRFRFEQIKDLVSKGFTQLDGAELINPKSGHREPLKGKAEVQVARQALRAAIDKAAHAAATSPGNDLAEPTAAQKEAGNYRKGHIVDFHGFRIAIENPDGSVRRGVDADGQAWESVMHGHYGYFKGITGYDKDHLDINIGPRPDLTTFYVIDQIDPARGLFDEHKVYAGYPSIAAAEAAYRSNYAAGWDGLQAIHGATLEEFRGWVDDNGPLQGSFAGWLGAREEASRPEVEAGRAVLTGPVVDAAPGVDEEVVKKSAAASDKSAVKADSPVTGAQERTVRAVDPGSSEPVQSVGEADGGSYASAIPDAVQASALQAARREQEALNAHDLLEEVRSLSESGGVDLTPLVGNPAYWDADSEEFTEAGVAEVIRLTERQARDNLRLPRLETLSDLGDAHRFAQVEAMEKILDGLGLDFERNFSFSSSRYLMVRRGDGMPDFKLRFADHLNTARDQPVPDINVAPGGESFAEALDAVAALGVPKVTELPWDKAAGQAALPGVDDTALKRLQATTVRFASGMSAIGDLGSGAYARGGHQNSGVGVDVGLLSKNGIETLANAIVRQKVKVFIDSGAFSNFRKSLKADGVAPLDFDAILTKYDAIQAAISEANPAEEEYPRPLLVMPDVVGDQAASLALVEKYKQWIVAETQFNLSTPIVPIQKGALSLEQAYRQVVATLGTDRFIVGLPSNAEAISRDELAAFLGAAQPPRVHFLGAAAPSKLDPLLAVVAHKSPNTEVTADASQIRNTILSNVKAGMSRNEAIIAALHDKNDPLVAPFYVDEAAAKNDDLDAMFDDVLAEETAKDAAPVLANATAPEHVALGVDDRELDEIVAEFNAFQQAMIGEGDEKVTHVFDAPMKSEVVRLADKAKVYHKDHGWMTPAEARARIAEWKAHAAAQYDDPAIRNANSQKVVLSLFDLTGKWSQPWEDAGYQVYRFDIQADPEVGDVNKFSTDFFNDWFGDFDGMDIHAVLAACPCTDFASSGARHFAAKDADGRTVASVKLVHQTLRAIEYFKPAVWAVENPVGRIEKLGGLPPWRLAFDPNQVGEDYTKKTLIWGRFNADLPIAPAEATEGSKMHRLYGGKSMATKNARSATPEGFAYSFFMANNAHDHPAMALANKFDRLDRGLIAQAVAAGVTPDEIESAVEDFYYQDLDDAAANQAIRDLLPDGTGGDEPTGKKETAPAADTAPAIEAPKGWRTNYGAAAKYAEALGIALRSDDKKFKKVPVLVAEIEAKLAAPSPAPVDAPPADAVDLGALFDEVLAEETAPAKNIERVKAKRAARETQPAESKEVRLHRLKQERDGLFQKARNAAQDSHVAEMPGYEQRKSKAGLARLNALVNEEQQKRQGQIDDVQRQIDALEGRVAPTAAPAPTRSGGAAAASAAKNVAGGLADAIAGLGALFGGNGRLSSGLTFDEETYAKAKPLFKQAIAHFAAAGGDLKEAMRAVVRMILDQFGKPAAENMKPYVVRFMADVQSGNLDYDEGKEAQDGNGQSDDGRDGAGGAGDPALGPVAAPEDGGPEGSGDAGDAGEPGGRAGAGRNRRAGGAGGRSRNGRGNGTAGIRDTAAGTRGGVSPSEAPAGIPAQNFVITEDVRLGQGGEMAKFNDNLAAIRLLKQLEAEKRRATPDEQRTLARYVGWGGLPNAFADKATGEFKKGWETRGPELAALLTADELAAARRSTMDAHYTAQPVVQAMWAAAERLGFRGGMVLEPSMGTGNFFGLVSDHLRGATKMVGVEYDALTARIAKALYPQSSVLHGGFQDVPLPTDSFDLAIGNPPYGKQSLYFPYNDKAAGLSGMHNQFMAASLDAVRPGGLQIMVVSRYLMDAKDDTTRRLLAEQAELVGAVRLPDSAFQENARTEVVTDILFLKKRSAADQAYFHEAMKDPDLRAEWPSWIETRDLPDPLGGEAMTVSRYYAENPGKVLGVMERSGSMRYGADVTVRAREGQDLRAAIEAAVAALPAGEPVSDAAVAASVAQFEAMREGLELVMEGREEGAVYVDEDGSLLQVMSREAPNGRDQLARRTLSPMAPWSPQLMMDAEGRWFRVTPKLDDKGGKVKNGRFVVYDRETFAREADVPETLRLGSARFERLQALIGLRDLLKRQIVLETSDGAGIDENRQALAKAYDAYVATHGFVGADLSQALLAGMPDGALVTALELKYDAGVSAAKAKKLGERMRKPSAVPAPILRQRVMVPYVAPDSANSAEDALFITLAERGRVDLERMAALLKTDEAAVIAALHETPEAPLIFRDPETARWETRDGYLSGQVVRKLNAARAAGLAKNVAALEKVQPAPIPASEIGVRLGSVWVPGDIYGDFVAEVTGAPAIVRFNKLMNLFDVRGNRDTVKSKTEFGTSRMNALDILEDLLNSRAVTVYDTYTDENGNKKRTLNEEATTEANAKADEIHNLFADWIMADGERRKRLATIYNEQFNNRVIRQYDGSQLTLPGKVPDQIITLRRHQKNAVWRGIVERFMLFDHTVGAGKTFTAIARNMERRRMGLSRKPMIVVPNHMVEQFAADVYRLYPGARVLAAGKADFEAKKRRRLFARIATGDWDMVIVPHSSFGFIGISPEREKAYIEADVADLEEMVKEAEADDRDGGWQKPPSVKEGERQLEALRERLKKVNDQKRDTLLTFEQLGVDDLTIDEAHEHKNLRYYTRLTKVLGLGNKQGSKKANDLFNKVRVLRESPNGSVTFMTGTPISNSVVEMYTMMRYLGMADLEEAGLAHFDAWHKQFAEAVTKFELNDANQLAEKTRLARWSNMPELMKLYYSFTDAVSLDDIKRWFSEDNGGAAFPVPRVKGGKRRNIIVEPTAAQQKILDEVVGEFSGLKAIKNPKERNAQRLRLMDRARKVSLDARAVDPYLATTEPGGKLERVSAEVARIYQQWTDDKGTQLVFLDRSVPKAKGDDKILAEYDRLKAEEAAALRDGDEATFLELQDKLEKFDAGEMAALRTAQSGGWNAYEQIKANLVAQGIPAGEIRFIQEANTDEQKQQLFEAVKAGEVRVLLGSTQRMGAGTNVQDRLVALHHVDVNWKPSDIEQREGRIIRQGNKLLEKYGMDAFEIEIMAYATERTYDAKMWALNEAKGRFINGLRAYAGEREVEIDDEESENMAEMAAMASGDPRMLERVQLDAEVKKLELMRRSHNRRQFAIQDQVADAEKLIARGPGAAEAADADWAAIVDADDKAETARTGRTVTIDGESFDKLFDAHQKAQALIAEMKGDNERARFQLAVNGELLTSVASVEQAIDEALGDLTPPGMVFNDGTTPTTRRAAAKILAEEIGKLEGQPDKAVGVGHLRGVPVYLSLEANSWSGKQHAVLHAKGRYVDDAATLSEVGADKLSLLSIRENLGKLAGKLSWYAGSARDLRERVKRAEADVGALREQASKPFAKQAEYEEKQDRLATLTAELAAEADQGGAKPRATGTVPAGDEPGLAAFSKPRREVVYTKDDFRVAIDISPTPEVARDVDFLREKIQELAARAGVSADGAAIQAVTVPDAAGGLVGVVKRLFNVDVRFVKADGLPADLAFDGIYVGRNVVYVNADSGQAYSAIIGHEFLHYLRHAAPDLYDDFVRQAARVIRIGPAGKAAAEEAETYRRFGSADSMAMGWEEIYADLFADSWADPTFWEAMAGQNQSLTAKVLQLLRRFINRIKAMLIRERHSLLRGELYRDFDAVRSVVLEATTRFAAEGYTPYQGLATTRFVTTPAASGGLGGLAAAGVNAGRPGKGSVRAPIAAVQQQAPAAVALQVVDKIMADGQLAAGRYRFAHDPAGRFRMIEVTTDDGGYVGAFAPDMAAGELVRMMNDEPGLLRDLQAALQPGGPEDGGPGGGKPPADEDLAFAQEVLTELAAQDELFRYPVSQAKTLMGVFGDVFPGFVYQGEDTRPDERQESGAEHRYVFRTEGDKDFYVFERGDEVWIDVSRLDEGERGGAVYAAILNYTHNAGKVLVGDPAGLSEAAVVRRTSAMLSSALRFGTTAHMAAAPEQEAGDLEKGIAPLDWRGDDLARIKALIHTFVTTTFNQFPKLAGYQYDFSSRQFTGPDGRPVSRERFYTAGERGDPRQARAGEATLRRALLLKSLVSSASGEKPGILEYVITRGHSLVRDGDLGAVFSRPRGERSVAGMAQDARQFLNDTFAGDTAKTFNFWHKTVGSQLHKAKVEPAFGRVYRGAQAFIDDVARYAAEAAERAPGVLPKMDTVAGALREVWHARRDAADTKAIAKPIFDGTLYEGEDGARGKVWSDRELADDFGLNARQIGLYREFRRAVDHSLESMAIAEMNKVARVHDLERPKFGMGMNELADFYAGQYADELAKLRAAYDERLKVYEATETLMRQNAAKPGMKMSYQKYMETMNGLKAEYEAEHNQIRRQIEDLERLDKAFREKAATINQLQREGYAPLMRFGKYTVDVVQMVPALDEDGQPVIDKETGEMQLAEERVFFSMFESEREAREAERIMAEEYPQATVTRGVASEDGWQLFGAVHPGSLEALIGLVGKEDEIVQRFYKEAVANRSALKRLIHRKGMAGYSEDVGRSLASFVLSNARAAATADHFGDMVEAANDIPKERGDVKDEAVQLINYVRNPNEEAGALRGLLFMQFLGGSIAAAAVNLTQSVTTTMPYMAQFGSGPGELMKAGRLALARMRGKGEGIDADLAAALARAEDEGVVAPHNIHALMGASGVKVAPLPAWLGGAHPVVNRGWQALTHVWGSLFGMAEQFNRETAFIMAFERAMDLGAQGMREAYDAAAKVAAGRGLPPPNRTDFASPYAFAKNAVNETQFVLSKAARPNWARGAVGATLFTFSQFKVFYLELFNRLPNRERALMLGTLIVLAGIGGAPGADDLDDLIDTLGQMMGYSTNAKKWKREAVAAIFGDMGSDFVLHGVSAFMPIDVAGRLGMGDLFPATGVLKKSNSGRRDKEFSQLLGAAGGYYNQLSDAADYLLFGRYGMAITQGLAPKAVKDVAKALDMAESGTYDDAKGRRVTDVSMSDAFWKAIGFQPSAVSAVQERTRLEQADIALVKAVKSAISEVLANAIHDNDGAGKEKAREMLAEWNDKNPESPISVSPAAVLRRVQQMRMSKEERMVKTAPKEMRASVRAALGE